MILRKLGVHSGDVRMDWNADAGVLRVFVEGWLLRVLTLWDV
jgi:hypothetical protein